MVKVGNVVPMKGVNFMKMIICGCDEKECQQIEMYVHDYYSDKDVDIQVRKCGEWQELYEQVKQSVVDVIIIAQSGVKGMDIITGLKTSAGKLIWFSDLDFGVQAYRLNVSYFNMFPITEEKVVHALQHMK